MTQLKFQLTMPVDLEIFTRDREKNNEIIESRK